MTATVSVSRSVPKTANAVGVPVGTTGTVPRSLGLNRAALAALGFEGKVGQTFLVPSATGATQVAVGIGDPGALTPTALRTAAAALVRTASRHAVIATSLADLPGVDAGVAGQAVTEGALLAGYRYAGVRSKPVSSALQQVVLVAGDARSKGVTAGSERGSVTAAAAILARDLANTPPSLLNARQIADKAVELAGPAGLTVEVFNRDQLEAMGCGGMIGVNRGSTEPPRLVKLTYTPRNASGHLALVGKGVMFDSGGLSLKPSDSMKDMKMDMSGAAAVLATMSSLKALKCRTKVTGYLMCTDNMPSGSAVKMGDVLTFRNGKTSEILNTDAEGRLVLADGLSLAVEERPDAVVDIATLTGACMGALGLKMAGLFSNDDALAARVEAAAKSTDEPLWRLPLEHGYRKMIDSNVADMKNVGGPYGGAIIAALFLHEFVGDTPWAHLDIAGPMAVEADDGWLSRGATGYGTRLLIDLALRFGA